MTPKDGLLLRRLLCSDLSSWARIQVEPLTTFEHDIHQKDSTAPSLEYHSNPLGNRNIKKHITKLAAKWDMKVDEVLWCTYTTHRGC